MKNYRKTVVSSLRTTKYFAVKKISHRLSFGVIYNQKVLKFVLMLNLPLKNLRMLALYSWWIPIFIFFFFITAIKNIRPEFSLGIFIEGKKPQSGWHEKKRCCLLPVLLLQSYAILGIAMSESPV